MARFSCKTKIISGEGALSALKELGIRRLFLVTDPYFVRSGKVKEILELSGAAETEIFSEVQPDPSVELAAQGTARLRAFEPDTVVALGGGSAMDCAKAMVYFSEHCPRLVAVPTTSGSGSEVTDFAILTHNGVKHPLIDKKLRPQMAILEAELLETLPAGLIADSGFDVLSHALEAYVATGSNLFTDALGENAFAGVLENLAPSYLGNRDVRLAIHQWATMAGVAFTRAGLGVCHAMSHTLGGLYHIPHGRLNAILLPAVIDQNRAAHSKYAALARRAGLHASSDTVAVRNLKSALCRLRRELRLPESLAQAGVSPAKVREKREEIIHTALKDPCCKTNPQPVTEQMVKAILEEVTGRG